MSAFDDLISDSPTVPPHAPTVGVPVVLPLSAFYARDRTHERRRAKFYATMSVEFGFENWRLAKIEIPAWGPHCHVDLASMTRLPVQPLAGVTPAAGRGGRRRQLLKPDRRSNVLRDLRQSVVGFFTVTNELNDPISFADSDRVKNNAHYYGEIRRRVMVRLRDLNEAAEGSPLKSVDLEREPTGGRRPGTVSDARLGAMSVVGRVRAKVPPVCMDLLDRAILNDDFDVIAVEGKEARKVLLEDMRLALDFAAWALGELPEARLLRRWKQVRDLLILRPALDEARRAK
ncbi:hypothetical protein [Mangrovibrevibacter kandeliae]|uniref:hypothetical protein n=1 Tax=Mangrovibrevibacter kandeliae TaxID=2968473 RepID=UPI0021184B3A|nr:hypothetical protein [Aurantimonas sp. CSK15Z-1]MCQ8781688.1 hypothetical protein [Aurantimonas sp. CSK15Z-1]